MNNTNNTDNITTAVPVIDENNIVAAPIDDNSEDQNNLQEEMETIAEAKSSDSILFQTIKKLSTLSNYIFFMTVVIALIIPMLIIGFTKTRFKDAKGKERVMRGADKQALIICGSIIGLMIAVVAILLLYVKRFRHIEVFESCSSRILILFIIDILTALKSFWKSIDYLLYQSQYLQQDTFSTNRLEDQMKKSMFRIFKLKK